MQKDIIYIDVEDDITAIIGKVKAADHKIVALVPPKRIGVLQSAVNLRLLHRAAEKSHKRLVLISNNSALASLAATADIPVAKNLQSKPELAEIAALEIDDGEDVIDGAELPVGEHASQVKTAADPSDDSAVAAAGLVAAKEMRRATPPAEGVAARPKVKRGNKVPSFNRFRKKLLLIILGVILLIGLLVWAIWFAPRAEVTVATRTTDSAVSQQVSLSSSADTSAENNLIRASTQQQTDDISVDFTATGEREVGERATGSIEFANDSLSSRDVPAGTSLESSSGLEYITDSSTSVPGATLGNCGGRACVVPGTATVSVTAAGRGAEYNGASGDVSGEPSGLEGRFTDATSGGTDKTAKVFTQNDLNKAREAAEDKIDEEAARNSLVGQFDDNFIVLENSLQVATGSLRADVRAGQEGERASYGGTVTYTLYAVNKNELDKYLNDVLEQQIDNSDQQRVYESGAAETEFTNVDKTDDGIRATLTTNGKIGPKITEEEVKELAIGKRYSDIKSSIEEINGVESVEIDFSPFWVSKAPDDVDKITINFQLDG